MTEALDHIVVGTAGHVDHGKSTLVEALTGTDPDRWEEEKRRGITIDLGFAHAEIGGHSFSFVDVPGHERFVHNMLAGATGIDLVLLVIAADESVMPQTREHLAICSLLGLKAGVVALSRIDLAEEGFADLAEEEVRETLAGTFLESAEIVGVSPVSGEGMEDLRAALCRAAEGLVRGTEGPWPRLGIDRVFAARGFGAVITGTLQGGSVAVGDALLAVPGDIEGRVRGIQVHGQSVDRAGPHRRVAINLQGVSREELGRGMSLVPRGRGVSTLFFDAELRLIREAPVGLEEGMRVRVNLGTAEVMARLRLPYPGHLAPGAHGAAQLRLEAPLAVLPGDRFIVRRYSPITTLGGGQVADIDPPRWRRDDPAWSERTPRLAQAGPVERVEILVAEAGPVGFSLGERALRVGADSAQIREALSGDLILIGGDRILSAEGDRSLRRSIESLLSAHHEAQPLSPGLPPLRVASEVAPGWSLALFREYLDLVREEGRIDSDRELVRLSTHAPSLEAAQKESLERLIATLDASGLKALGEMELRRQAEVGRESSALLDWAVRTGSAVRLKDDSWISGKAWQEMVDALRREFEAGRGRLGVPVFKELFGLSRKYAIPLLERLDDAGITRRAGNERVLRF